MNISHSGHEKYLTCPFSYYLHYKEGIKSAYESVNLAFGKVEHEVYAEYLMADHRGSSYDTGGAFKEKWKEVTETTTLQYTSGNFTPEDVTAVGYFFASEFPSAWEKTGLTVHEDAKGLFIERSYKVKINGSDIHRGIIDLGADTPEGEFAIIDHKFVGAQSPHWFAQQSPQLKSYQIFVEESATDGKKIDKLGFFENIKRKVPARKGQSLGPQICMPVLAPAHDQQTLLAHKQALNWSLENIKKGRFPKTPGSAFNTPCTLCEYRGYCYESNKEGLIFPDEKRNKQVSII